MELAALAGTLRHARASPGSGPDLSASSIGAYRARNHLFIVVPTSLGEPGTMGGRGPRRAGSDLKITQRFLAQERVLRYPTVAQAATLLGGTCGSPRLIFAERSAPREICSARIPLRLVSFSSWPSQPDATSATTACFALIPADIDDPVRPFSACSGCCAALRITGWPCCDTLTSIASTPHRQPSLFARPGWCISARPLIAK